MVAVVTCLFNPAGWKSRGRNYSTFADAVRAAGCTLYCVELLYGDAEPVCDADVKINLWGDESHVLWQKESLLSIGLNRAIDDGQGIIGWFDADVVIPPDWARLAETVLSKRSGPAILHAGSQWIRQFSGGVRERWRSALLAPHRPFVGGGWLGHAELWRTTGLFDMCIVGGGDWPLATAFLSASGQPLECPWSHALRFPKIRALWESWRAGIPQLCEATAVPATVTLLPHGSRSRRGYDSRMPLLDRFDPLHDVRRRSDGILEWTGLNARLQDEVRQYFLSRREDD